MVSDVPSWGWGTRLSIARGERPLIERRAVGRLTWSVYHILRATTVPVNSGNSEEAQVGMRGSVARAKAEPRVVDSASGSPGREDEQAVVVEVSLVGPFV